MLEAEVQVFQVGINFADAAKLTGTCAAEQAIRRTPDAGRYILTDAMANGPAMFDTTCLDQASGMRRTAGSRHRTTNRQSRRSALHRHNLTATHGPSMQVCDHGQNYRIGV